VHGAGLRCAEPHAAGVSPAPAGPSRRPRPEPLRPFGRRRAAGTLAFVEQRRGGRTPWRSFVPGGPTGIATVAVGSAVLVAALGGSFLAAALVVPVVVLIVMTVGYLFFNPYDEPLPDHPLRKKFESPGPLVLLGQRQELPYRSSEAI